MHRWPRPPNTSVARFEPRLAGRPGMSGTSVATTPEALSDIQVAGSGPTETRTSANRPLPRTGLVETVPPLSRGVARSSLWPHIRTDLATLPATRLRRGDRGVVRDLGRRGARGARVLAPASRATSLVSQSGPGRGQGDGGALAAAGRAGRARTLAASRADEVSSPRDRLVWAAWAASRRVVSRGSCCSRCAPPGWDSSSPWSPQRRC
jgi:hypothetical protein